MIGALAEVPIAAEMPSVPKALELVAALRVYLITSVSRNISSKTVHVEAA